MIKKICLWLLFTGSIVPITLLALPAETTYFYASQSGKTTLDQGEGGGNPFASAFVDLLKNNNTSFKNFQSELIRLTEEKSKGHQKPEIVSSLNLDEWQFLPKILGEKRIALILVFSNYKVSGMNSLPGVRNDLNRVSKSLSKAGFEITTAIDPDKKNFEHILNKFSGESKKSEVSLIYTTGHGVEVNHKTYLLPNNYSLISGKSKLKYNAVEIKNFGKKLKAEKANLFFYGGCRNNPF